MRSWVQIQFGNFFCRNFLAGFISDRTDTETEKVKTEFEENFQEMSLPVNLGRCTTHALARTHTHTRTRTHAFTHALTHQESFHFDFDGDGDPDSGSVASRFFSGVNCRRKRLHLNTAKLPIVKRSWKIVNQSRFKQKFETRIEQNKIFFRKVKNRNVGNLATAGPS